MQIMFDLSASQPPLLCWPPQVQHPIWYASSGSFFLGFCFSSVFFFVKGFSTAGMASSLDFLGLGLGYQSGHFIKCHVLLPEDFLSNLSWKVMEQHELDVLHVFHVAEFGEIDKDLNPGNKD